ncbi:MAG: EAL and HDOD domain-containing protein [Gemmatimonadota bacterium]
MFAAPETRGGGEAPVPLLQSIRAQWCTIVARDRRPIGVRVALRAAAGMTGAAALPQVLAAVVEGFSAGGGAPFPRGLVVLAPQGFAIDDALLGWSAPRNVLLEVGIAELAADAQVERLHQVQRNGTRLVLRVDDGHVLNAGAASVFQYALADVRLRPGGLLARIGWLASGAATREEAEQAFGAGAHAIVGWPVNEAKAEAPGALHPSQTAVLELVRLLQADAEVAELEQTFRSEPVLAYLLITLANSPAFRRGTPIGSVSQAIALLGYRRLLKWMILLLVIASKGSRTLPQIYAAVARGFFIENLALELNAPEVSQDGFVIGAFSLLDRITGMSARELLGSIELPPSISDAVLNDAGPAAPYLRLARALEGVSDPAHPASEVPAAAPAQVNLALLQALAATDALQSLM